MPNLRHFLIPLMLVQTIFCGSAESQTWSDVPEHVSSSMDTFRDLFRNAHTEGFGISILGDSQETAPDGAGTIYLPSLGDEFFRHYGNVPKVGIVTGISQSRGWLSAASNSGIINLEKDIGLPAVDLGTYGTTPAALGMIVQVNTDGYTSPYFDPPANGYFNGHDLEASIVARTRPDSGEITWRAGLTEDDRGHYFTSEQIGSGTTNLGLARESIEFVSSNLGTFDLDGHSALQIIARSGTENATVDIAGIQFRNTGDSSGVAVQSFSKGGFDASRFLSDYSDDASLFNIVAADDVVALQYGINDSLRYTAEEFKENILDIILTLRDWTDDPDLPFLLISDPDMVARTEAHRENFDAYPGVAAELATEYENILALNTRVIGARNNWYVGSTEFDSFAPDGGHYSQLGATSLAKWQVDSLLSLTAVPEPSIFFPISVYLAFFSLKRRRSN